MAFVMWRKQNRARTAKLMVGTARNGDGGEVRYVSVLDARWAFAWSDRGRYALQGLEVVIVVVVVVGKGPLIEKVLQWSRRPGEAVPVVEEQER